MSSPTVRYMASDDPERFGRKFDSALPKYKLASFAARPPRLLAT